MMLAYFESS